jgi:hypothetical protein
LALLSVKKTSVRNHDRIADLADKYPFMQQGWTQAEILQAGDLLEKKLPESDGQGRRMVNLK